MLRPNALPVRAPGATTPPGGPARRDGRGRRWSSMAVVGALVGASVMWAAGATPASAATRTIPCNGPNGTATANNLSELRDILHQASFAAGPDTIVLSPNCTYSFTDAYRPTSL